MQFVDTNIFIRHLPRDDPDKAQACFELFQRAGAN
jgi:predicted nucleic acid-binding protein